MFFYELLRLLPYHHILQLSFSMLFFSLNFKKSIPKTVSFTILFFIHLSQLGCLVGCDAGIDDLFDISVHDLV